MKSYTESVIQILSLARNKDEYIFDPDMLDDTEKHKDTPHDTRVGYLGRLCKTNIIEKKGDPKLEQYVLTPYGLWVLKMYESGWKYSNNVWSYGDVAIDEETSIQCYTYGIVPIVSSLLEN